MEPEERGLTPKNKRILTKHILTALDKSAEGFSENTFYRRPYTVVMVYEHYDDKKRFFGVGCSKVCWPDLWEEEKGRDIAMAKAAQDLAEIMLKNIVSLA